MVRIGIDSIARETMAQVRAHRSAFATLAAAFVFLPGLTVGLLAPTAAFGMPTMGAMPHLPPWFWLSTLVTLLLQTLAGLTIAAIAGDARRRGTETVGATLGRMLGALLRYAGAIVLMAAGYLIVAVPTLLILVMATGAGAVLRGVATPQVAAVATQQVVGVFLLFAVPVFLWLAARLAPLLGVFAAEPLSPVGGIRRAWALGRKSTGPLLALLILVVLASFLVALLGQGLGSALGSLATLGGSVALGRATALVVASLFSAAVFVGIAAGSGVIYRQLRER